MLGAALLLALAAQEPDPARAVISVERVWDRAEHQAFTDLVHHDGRWFLAFREGASHVHGRDGVVRVLVAEDADALDWRAAGLIAEEGVDLRDPKLSVTPDGRLMVVMGGSVYDGRELVGRAPRVAFGAGDPLVFTASLPATIDERIAGDRDWLWRVTWHEGVGYGVVYQPVDGEWGLHLVATRDGRRYDHVATLDVAGRPNETTLRFREDGAMVALVRREGADRRAVVGQAAPPFTGWSWATLPAPVGGPNFVVLPGGAMVLAGREYAEGGARTWLARFDVDGTLAPLLRLPSGGDTSYPGMVVRGERLVCSYYSGHEGKTSVYLARLRLPNLLARE